VGIPMILDDNIKSDSWEVGCIYGWLMGFCYQRCKTFWFYYQSVNWLVLMIRLVHILNHFKCMYIFPAPLFPEYRFARLKSVLQKYIER
jgi:hypothetical protein